MLFKDGAKTEEELVVGSFLALQPLRSQDDIVQFLCQNRGNSALTDVARLDELDEEASVSFCSTVLQGAFDCQFLGKEADEGVKHESVCPNLRAVEQRQAVEIPQALMCRRLITVTGCHRCLH